MLVFPEFILIIYKIGFVGYSWLVFNESKKWPDLLDAVEVAVQVPPAAKSKKEIAA